MKWIALALTTLSLTFTAHADLVKQSSSGICHDNHSRYYERTRNYTAYDSLEQCLKTGGRLPKGDTRQAPESTSRTEPSSYSRSAFGNWADKAHIVSANTPKVSKYLYLKKIGRTAMEEVI